MNVETEFQNQLYYGDNLEIMRKSIADESIDLCYIDPPFNSKRNYNQIYNNIGKEDTAQVHAFTDTWTWNIAANEGYEAIISNYSQLFTMQTTELIMALKRILGKGPLLAYIISLTQRIAEIYRVLKPTGSFYLHCDPTASHYIKLILDSVFVSRGGDIRNEIVWCYNKWSNKILGFQKNHDVILFYSKSSGNNTKFNILHNSNSSNDKTQRRDKGYTTNTIKDGDKRISQLIVYDKEKASNVIESGKYDKVIYREDNVIPLPDWWEISILNSQAKERLGYPTQKPEVLLERIIKASSNEGDLVFDAYCGCGTTIAVAQRLNRKWIGIDITYNSVSLIMKRLEDTFGEEILNEINLNGMPKDFGSAVALANKKDDRLRKEFEKWAVLTYTNNRGIINEKKGGDGGIDGIAYIPDVNTEGEQINNKVLFQVKTSKVLNPSVIRDLDSVVSNNNAVMGILITLYPADNLTKNAGSYGAYTNKLLGKSYNKIQVININEIMSGARLELTTMEVLKKAERKSNLKQSEMEI